MIFVLTGNGKGKTTSALGMGLRAAGAARKVLMAQFLKSGRTSENKILEQIADFNVKSFGRDICVTKENASQEDFDLAEQGFLFAKEALNSGQCDFLILDEICVALRFGLLKNEDILLFLKQASPKTDIVLTGRYCPKTIIDIADLVTEVKEIKHYFKKGQKARKGIEY